MSENECTTCNGSGVVPGTGHRGFTEDRPCPDCTTAASGESPAKRIAALESEVAELRGLLREVESRFRKHLWGAYSCPKNDEAKAFVDRLAAELKEGENDE